MDVLLVEDEALVREMLAEVLTDAGLDVAATSSAEGALRVAGEAWDASQPPQVLVTDVDLGAGMDGVALVAEIRRRWPDLGVVVMTGRPSNLNGRDPDPDEICLHKPFRPHRLTTAVQDLMRKSRSRTEAARPPRE